MNNSSTKIAVLSGKGGTGKTLVSVNLAAVAERSVYIDCDVEEPNGHLFFKPKVAYEEVVAVSIPVVNNDRCNGCRECVAFCKFNALAFIKGKPVVFEEVCHSCGGCALLCPKKAISEKEKTLGTIQRGKSGNVTVSTGILQVGEASGSPIIKRLLEASIETGLPVFIDCPPGSACIVMESIKDADYCVLVAEPTVFGAHNLNMVYELVKLHNKPFGVVLNKYVGGIDPSELFCNEKGIRILGRIPFEKELGTIHSNAQIAVEVSEKYKVLFLSLFKSVMKEARHETTVNP